ncbi:MAG: ABC transporter permease [Galactobacillus timonensis]|uniref:ABC transporter permease n=1 Tax=Galactobacillus timonensis TaxID=2041840 RepID=UPI0023F1A49F|nr:ABC transporter permease [Galactobacillus timonensis]MCI6067378.1 ABC transporter permease [Galactobacillus timonensis]
MKLEDVKQVTDALYAFLSSIDINGIPWRLEYLDNDTETALMFKSQGYSQELKKFIDGGYQAVFPFEVYIQASRRDTKARLNLSRILEAVWLRLSEEESAGFPNLKLEGATPLSIMRTSLPADYTGEKAKLSVFSCAFTLTYEKEGDFSEFLK